MSVLSFLAKLARDRGGLANECGGPATVRGSTFTRNTAGSGNSGLNHDQPLNVFP
jgi:hypothetical protein